MKILQKVCPPHMYIRKHTVLLLVFKALQEMVLGYIILYNLQTPSAYVSREILLTLLKWSDGDGI